MNKVCLFYAMLFYPILFCSIKILGANYDNYKPLVQGSSDKARYNIIITDRVAAGLSIDRMWAHLSRWCQSAVNVKETQDVSVRREPVGFFHFSPSFFYLNSSSSPVRSKEKHTGNELFACDPTRVSVCPSVQSS